MTDVYIVTLSVIGIILSSVGVAVTINMLLPKIAERAYTRLDDTPFKSFALGALVGLPWAGLVILLVSLPPGWVKAIGGIIGVFGLGVRAVGAAGMARLFGERFDAKSPLGRIVKGAFALNCASFAPLVGWFLVTPLVGLQMIGASIFALLKWMPKEKADDQVQVVQNVIDTSAPAGTMPVADWR